MKSCLLCGTHDGPFEEIEFVEVDEASVELLEDAFENGETSSAPICLNCVEAMEAEVAPDRETLH